MAEIICAAVTAFGPDEKPDYPANKRIIDFLIEKGINGILVLGSTGEFTSLSVAEKEAFFQFYSEYAGGRIKLYAGTGTMCYDETVSLSNAAIRMGFEAAIVMSPFYYALDQEKIYAYYRSVADAVNGNIMLYNFPNRSTYSISPATFERLVQDTENIIGIKDTISSRMHVFQCCNIRAARQVQVYSGFDDQFLDNLAFGGSGAITGMANVVPDIWSRWIRAVDMEDFDTCQKITALIYRLMPIYFMDSNASLLLKCLMVHRGVEIPERAIFPFNGVSREIRRNAEQILDKVLHDFADMT